METKATHMHPQLKAILKPHQPRAASKPAEPTGTDGMLMAVVSGLCLVVLAGAVAVVVVTTISQWLFGK